MHKLGLVVLTVLLGFVLSADAQIKNSKNVKKKAQASVYLNEYRKGLMSPAVKDTQNFIIERKKEIEKELGDVLWYLTQIATEMNLELNDIAEKNIENEIEVDNYSLIIPQRTISELIRVLGVGIVGMSIGRVHRWRFGVL